VADWFGLTTEEFSADRIAVLPVAAVEQHGPHLPVGVDTYIAEAYLARVRGLLPGDSPVVLLPVQQVGASDEHRAFRGTLTLSPETTLAAFIEIGESVSRAGIAKLVIVNSHGGNIAPIDLAARQLRVRANMLAVHCSWGRFGYPDGLFSDDERTHGIHGGDIETSIMLAAYPDLVRREKIADFKPEQEVKVAVYTGDKVLASTTTKLSGAGEGKATVYLDELAGAMRAVLGVVVEQRRTLALARHLHQTQLAHGECLRARAILPQLGS